jgi:CubicO group peptidase (beta-lactamase class C family)
MERVRYRVAVLLVAASCGGEHPATPDAGPDGTPFQPLADCSTAYPALVQKIQVRLAAANVPGASIAIVTHDKLACSAGIGMRDLSTQQPTTGQTRFVINSMSKVFAAAAAMTLVERGALDVSAPITTYAPYVAVPSTLTTAMLLDHTSGYPNAFPTSSADGVHYQTPDALQEFFMHYANEPLWSPPGAVWDYSNFGYALVGLVVSNVAQEEFGSYVERAVIAPAGMLTATYEPTIATVGDHATGYAMMGSTLTPYDTLRSMTNYAARPFGGVMASAEDMGHFMEMLLANGGSVLQPSSVQALATSHASTGAAGFGYGYGLFVEPQPGATIVEHSGGGRTFVSDFEIIPELGYGFVILVNDGGYGQTRLDLDDARDAVVGLGPYMPAGVNTPPSTWTKYEGTYVDPTALGTMTVSVQGDTLSVHFADHAFDATFHQSDADEFWTDQVPPWLPPTSEITLTFFADASGVVRYAATRAGVGTRP